MPALQASAGGCCHLRSDSRRAGSHPGLPGFQKRQQHCSPGEVPLCLRICLPPRRRTPSSPPCKSGILERQWLWTAKIKTINTNSWGVGRPQSGSSQRWGQRASPPQHSRSEVAGLFSVHQSAAAQQTFSVSVFAGLVTITAYALWQSGDYGHLSHMWQRGEHWSGKSL